MKAKALAAIAIAAAAALLSAPTAAAGTAQSGSAATAAETAPSLRVGVGRADITPVTGGFKGGWACSCAPIKGQHTRLFARVVVVEQGGLKVALVVTDLAMIGGGMIRGAAELVNERGYSERNVIASATHTHGSQVGYMNFSSYNSVLPHGSNPTEFDVIDTAADPVMYNFMTRQLAQAISRADEDLRPGAIGWGQSKLLGVTQNRSLEAHLANHGIHEPVGKGTVDQDPAGYEGTIDPLVDVLRVDQYRDDRRVPVGMYSTFANHGTTVSEGLPYFSGDHHATAERVVEDTIRREGNVPSSQTVVNAFASSDSGDVTSGIAHTGSPDAEYVGRREADAMLTAWRQAGEAMTSTPELDLRWTRICLCGQQADDGSSDSVPWIGAAAGAGSEEGRTIFYDAGLVHEGDRLPLEYGPQGNKITVLNQDGSLPDAVPLTTLRLGDRVIVSYPGEPTVGVGQELRAAVEAAGAAAGVKKVVIAGFAGEYLSYWTTPAEYAEQHYEGGFTLFGKYSSGVLRDTIVDLVRRLGDGQPAPEPYEYDPNNGVHVTGEDYGSGAANGTVTTQPTGVDRLGQAAFAWQGGSNGIDRPVDSAFVTVQRQSKSGWQPVTDDLGMQIVWMVDEDGNHRARWEVPLTADPGQYRFLITAKRYQLTSQPFEARTGAILTPAVSGDVVELRYPEASAKDDWTHRPAAAAGGTITFLVDGRRVTVRQRAGQQFPIPAGESVTIPAGSAFDRYGNTNQEDVRVR